MIIIFFLFFLDNSSSLLLMMRGELLFVVRSSSRMFYVLDRLGSVDCPSPPLRGLSPLPSTGCRLCPVADRGTLCAVVSWAVVVRPPIIRAGHCSAMAVVCSTTIGHCCLVAVLASALALYHLPLFGRRWFGGWLSRWSPKLLSGSLSILHELHLF